MIVEEKLEFGFSILVYKIRIININSYSTGLLRLWPVEIKYCYFNLLDTRFVVYLLKLRTMLGQYQALSQDPNSLSNLDQDLPNNMIHQVRLFFCVLNSFIVTQILYFRLKSSPQPTINCQYCQILQVPIKSLPQEWLWCETWCSTDELKNAKSIDLCNNPLTKVSGMEKL